MSKELIIHESDIKSLDFIANLQADSVLECCRVSLIALTEGNQLSSKALAKAASKLSLEQLVVENGLKALGHLFLQSAKQMKNQSRCLASYHHLGIPKADILSEFCFQEAIPLIRPILETFGAKEDTSYHKMHWRMEALLQTRAEHVREIQPVVSVKLNDEITFDAAPKTLENLNGELESALVALKCPLVKKLQRFL